MQKLALLLACVISFAVAAGHAVIGQAHLSRILESSTESIDSAVMFAVWHMVTVVLALSGICLFLLALCKQNSLVRAVSLMIAILFFLFAVVFMVTSFVYGEPTIQWIPMLVVSILSIAGYVLVGHSNESPGK